jgi:hypothetical protein
VPDSETFAIKGFMTDTVNNITGNNLVYDATQNAASKISISAR